MKSCYLISLLGLLLGLVGIPAGLAAEARKDYPPNAARDALEAACRQATAESKLVFLKSGFPECGWCRVFDRYHASPEVQRILGRHYVIVAIDTKYMPDGASVFGRYAQPGAPSWVILSADQRSIGDSYAPSGNVGYPLEPQETAHYLAMLKKATPALSSEDLKVLSEQIRKAAEVRLERWRVLGSTVSLPGNLMRAPALSLRLAVVFGFGFGFRFGMPARGQGVLNAGEVLEYHFDGLPLVGRFFDIPGRGTEAGILSVALVSGSLSAGEDFRVEMFEGAASEIPILSRTFSNPGTILDQAATYWVAGAWQDRAGAMRLTGLSGSVVFREVYLNARSPVPGEPGRYDLYSLSVPVPEPAVSALALVGCGLAGLWRVVRGRGRRLG